MKADPRNLPQVDTLMIIQHYHGLRHPAMKHVKLKRFVTPFGSSRNRITQDSNTVDVKPQNVAVCHYFTTATVCLNSV